MWSKSTKNSSWTPTLQLLRTPLSTNLKVQWTKGKGEGVAGSTLVQDTRENGGRRKRDCVVSPFEKTKQASRFEVIGIEKTTTAIRRRWRTTHPHTTGATKKHERRDPRNKNKLGYYNYCYHYFSCLSLQQPPLYTSTTISITTTPSCFSFFFL